MGEKEKLKRLFRHYGGADGDGDADVSIVEFLLFAKQCGLLNIGFSFAKVIDVFIDANEEEVQRFLMGQMEEDIAEVLSMDFDEFLDAMTKLVLRLPMEKRDKKSDKWPALFQKIYHECPANNLN